MFVYPSRDKFVHYGVFLFFFLAQVSLLNQIQIHTSSSPLNLDLDAITVRDLPYANEATVSLFHTAFKEKYS